MRLDCCTNATGKGRAIVVIFLTIVNVLHSQRGARYIKDLKALSLYNHRDCHDI